LAAPSGSADFAAALFREAGPAFAAGLRVAVFFGVAALPVFFGAAALPVFSVVFLAAMVPA
jgi:hypothetical protein